jgi:hypothetical protein
MWPAVAKVLGQPELTEDARFKTVEARRELLGGSGRGLP